MAKYLLTNDALDIPADTLLDLVDDEREGTLEPAGQARIDQAIAYAEATIDGYCSGRYGMPFATVPPLVPALAVKVARYQLYSRRSLTEDVRQQYDNALRMLEHVASGKLSLGADPAPAASSQAAQASEINVTSESRKFSRKTMAGF